MLGWKRHAVRGTPQSTMRVHSNSGLFHSRMVESVEAEQNTYRGRVGLRLGFLSLLGVRVRKLYLIEVGVRVRTSRFRVSN